MGKTTYITQVLKPIIEQTQSSKFYFLSNDDIRKQMIDEFLKKNPHKTSNDAF